MHTLRARIDDPEFTENWGMHALNERSKRKHRGTGT